MMKEEKSIQSAQTQAHQAHTKGLFSISFGDKGCAKRHSGIPELCLGFDRADSIVQGGMSVSRLFDEDFNN